MTVLQVCAYAAPYEGNFIKSLQALAEELEKKGHRVIYAFPDSARQIEWCKKLAEHTDVHFLPLAKARIRLETYLRLRKIYQTYPDLEIIHTHFELYDVPVSLTRPSGVRVFWHLHDALEVYDSFKHRFVHKVQYGMLHRGVVLLSVSEKHMKYVLENGFPENRAKHVPNGLDTERIKNVSCTSDKEFDFLIFGWEFERKGVDLCIEAVKELDQQVSVGIVGNEQTAKILLQRYGELSGITVLRPVEDINLLYRQSRCFLHISRAEGLSYALLEAVYAGLPVICSDIPENCFAQIFPTVTMVRNNDAGAIASAMQGFVSGKEVSTDNILAAQKQVEDMYSISRWVKNMLACYGV